MTSPAVAWGTKIESRPSLGVDVVEEGGAGGGQVGQAAGAPGPDRQLAGLYGKMLRRASRSSPEAAHRRRRLVAQRLARRRAPSRPTGAARPPVA